MGTLYAEDIFLLNLSLNWLIIWLCGRLYRPYPARWRAWLGAGVGALASLAYAFFSQSPWLVVLEKFGLSLLMVTVVWYPWSSWRQLLGQLIHFYLVSFALGGGVLGLLFWAERQGTAFTDRLWPIFSALAWALPLMAVLGWLWGLCQPLLTLRQAARRAYQRLVRVAVGEQVVACQGWLDSGNHLVEPLSGWPVLVVEKEAVKQLLPERLDQPGWETRWRWVPFQGLGHQQGLLPAFKPDWVEIESADRTVRSQRLLVAIYEGSLGEHYQALLPERIEEGI
ncbi:MAG: sigma-E processing peptidase SpoIIGA [Bacillota bacterium]